MRKHVKGMRGGRRGETRKKRGVVELHVAEKCPAHLPSQCSLWWPTPFVPLCSVCLWERYREQLSKSVGDVDKAFMILHCVSTAVGTHTNAIRLLYTHAQGSLHNKIIGQRHSSLSTAEGRPLLTAQNPTSTLCPVRARRTTGEGEEANSTSCFSFSTQKIKKKTTFTPPKNKQTWK